MRIPRFVVNFFIALNLVAVTFWCIPYFPVTTGYRVKADWNIARARIDRFFEPYLLLTGLWQGWDMFSPDPLVVNPDVEAEITMRDGTERHYLWPRMNELGLFERYQKERYRKWRERLPSTDYKVIWRDAVIWVARRFNEPGNPPVSVSLWYYTAAIPPPQPGDYQPWSAFTPRDQRSKYYTYAIQPSDLAH